MPELFVTNFNRNFTGVSATAANVVRCQQDQFDMRLVGIPLPDVNSPIPLRMARALSARKPDTKPFSIWHVRRNTEMRAGIWSRDVLGLPIKLVFTSAAQRRHSAFPRWLISRMDAVIATTDKAAEFIAATRAVVPHGVDTKRFHPAKDRLSAWREHDPDSTRAIATVGRIRPEKGTDVFVDAMIRALPDLPGTVALIIGRAGGKHETFLQGLKDKVAAAGLTERIRFPGEAPANTLPDLLRSVSLVVQLPRYEGYGMVPLEAMASGTPFVASDAGHYRDFSDQERAGLIVPIEDSDQAAEAVKALMSDENRFLAASLAARATVETRFGAQREADGIAEVYEQLWNEGATR